MSSTARRRRRSQHSPRKLPRTPTGNVEVLLIQTIDHLGQQGEVVAVKPGYARNYLLPQGLATIATEHHKRMIEKHKARLQEIQRARLAGLRALAETIGAQSVTIEANANDEGHLYGSVGANDIVAALKGNGITITPDQVRLTGPLKELGMYTVQIHLGYDIDAQLRLWVVPAVQGERAAPGA
ncbi:MAG: 50S ribosomal protein L9 [Pirellulales bacterium]|nr:50S ribosomal protein L9 [Pirellulales bacterium]